MSEQNADKYIVRFPEGLRQRLKEAAQENGRSLNAEIVQRLIDSFDHNRSNIVVHDQLEQATNSLKHLINQAERVLTRVELTKGRVEKRAKSKKPE